MARRTLLLVAMMVVFGCSQEEPAVAPLKPLAVPLSAADRESLLAFRKNLLNTESIADKAVKVGVDEVKKIVAGGQVTVNLPAILERTKAECLKAGSDLAMSAIPAKLPPEMQGSLRDGRDGLIAAYQAYGEAFDAARNFTAEKNPMQLVEYRKKYSQAQESYRNAAAKIKSVMNACGMSAVN